MSSFGQLWAVEARRALSRRAVWVLLGIALLGIAVTGVVAFTSSSDFDPSVPQVEPDVARLTDLWMAGSADGVLTFPLIFLLVGALIGGATVVGAEWQHGTVVTVCTWEVRRGRLLASRLLAVFVLAALIGCALQVVFCASLIPTYLLRGTTDGTDAAFWRELIAAIARISLLTGMAALLGATLASLGKRTTAALGVAFVYLAIVENVVRGNWPDHGRWLIGENAAVLISAADLEGFTFTRSVPTATLTLCGYMVVLIAAAVVLFRRRDLAGSS